MSAARNKATNPRPGTSGSLPGGTLNPATTANGAAAAAKAVRALFLQKWKSERHALLFKPLSVEVGAEVHQWDQPGGKAIAPTYRVARVNVGVGELQVGRGGACLLHVLTVQGGLLIVFALFTLSRVLLGCSHATPRVHVPRLYVLLLSLPFVLLVLPLRLLPAAAAAMIAVRRHRQRYLLRRRF